MVLSLYVYQLKDVCAKSANIKKPFIAQSHPHNTRTVVFDIYYKNEFLLIDLPGKQILSKRGRDISFVDSTVSHMTQLELLVESVLERVRTNSKYQLYFENKTMYRMIENKGITFKNVCEYDTSVFDMMEGQIDLSRLKANDNARLLIYIKNIWANESFYGINIKLSQIQRLEPMGLNKSLFVNPRIPPPPKPPLMLAKKNQERITNPKNNKIVRPSLKDILKSRENLRKTNLLS